MKKIFISAVLVQFLASYSHANQMCVELFETASEKSMGLKAGSSAEANYSVETVRARAVTSGQAVKSYFDALGNSIFERGNVLKIFLNAIVAKEHVLLVGAPGNAKTTLSKLVFENIIDPTTQQPSFFATQMTAETSLSDTHGGINYEVLNRTGRQERLYDEGILGARFAMLDEQFDMRPNGYRNILDVLAERAHAQGGKKHKGLTWTVVGASNTFIPEVYQKFDGSEQPRALIDRYAYVILVPAELEKVASRRAVVKGSTQAQKQLPVVTLNDFEALQKLVPQVEIPDYIADILTLIQYRLKTVVEAKEQTSLQEFKDKVLAGERPIPPYKSTKYMSDRTMGKAARVLAANVAIDFALNGGKRKLVVNMSDLNILVDFYSLGGPETDAEIQHQISRAAKEIERDQLKTILWERKTAKEIITTVVGEINKKLTQLGAQDLYQKVRLFSTLSAPERRELIDMLRAFYVRGLEISTMDQKQIDQNPGLIAEVSMADMAVKWLDFMNLSNKAQIIASWTANAPITKKRNTDGRYTKVNETPNSSYSDFNGNVRRIEDSKRKAIEDAQRKAQADTETKKIRDQQAAAAIEQRRQADEQQRQQSDQTSQNDQVKGSTPTKIYDPMVLEEVKNFISGWDVVSSAIVKEYLERGLDPNGIVISVTGQEWTLMGIAAYFNRTDIIQLALDHGADYSAQSTYGGRSLDTFEWAKLRNNTGAMELLLKHIANQNAVANTTVPVAKTYKPEVLEKLKKTSIKWSQVKLETIENFLNEGLDPNSYVYFNKGSEEWTLIGIMALYGRTDIVKLALDHGADPQLMSMFREKKLDALGWAKNDNRTDTVELLEKHFALGKGQTAAAPQPKVYNDQATKELLSLVKRSDAITLDWISTAQLEKVLSEGADPNVFLNENNWTMLNYLSTRTDIKSHLFAPILLKYGARTDLYSISYKQGYKRNGLEWARNYNNTALVELFEQHEKAQKAQSSRP